MSWREFPIISCIKWAQLNCYMKNEALCVFDNDTDLQLSDDLVWFGEEWIVNVMEKKVSPWLFHFRALVFLWGYSGSSLSDIGFDFRIFVLSEVKIQKYVQGSPSMRLFFPLCQTLVFSFPWRLDWLPLHPSSQLVSDRTANKKDVRHNIYCSLYGAITTKCVKLLKEKSNQISLLRTHFWVGVTVRAVAPPNVDLVLSGFLIDGVIKVNRVGVLLPVVPP